MEKLDLQEGILISKEILLLEQVQAASHFLVVNIPTYTVVSAGNKWLSNFVWWYLLLTIFLWILAPLCSQCKHECPLLDLLLMAQSEGCSFLPVWQEQPAATPPCWWTEVFSDLKLHSLQLPLMYTIFTRQEKRDLREERIKVNCQRKSCYWFPLFPSIVECRWCWSKFLLRWESHVNYCHPHLVIARI